MEAAKLLAEAEEVVRAAAAKAAYAAYILGEAIPSGEPETGSPHLERFMEGRLQEGEMVYTQLALWEPAAGNWLDPLNGA